MWLYKIYYKYFDGEGEECSTERYADNENDAEYEFVEAYGVDNVYVTYIEQIG